MCILCAYILHVNTYRLLLHQIAAPSPTVNTKFAMQNVMGMFDHTLEIENNFGWNRNDTEIDEFEDEFAVADGKYYKC